MHSDILVIKTFKSKEEAKQFNDNLNDLFLKYVRYDYTLENSYIDYTRNYYYSYNNFLNHFKEAVVSDDSYISSLGLEKTEIENVFLLDFDVVEHRLLQRMDFLESYLEEKINELEPTNIIDLTREIIYELDENYGGFKILDISSRGEKLESEIEFFSRVFREKKKMNIKELYFIPICFLDYHF